MTITVKNKKGGGETMAEEFMDKIIEEEEKQANNPKKEEKKVHLFVGFTKNLGNYESFDISFSISKTTYEEAVLKVEEIKNEVLGNIKNAQKEVVRNIQEESINEIKEINKILEEEKNMQRRKILLSRKNKLIERVIEAGFDPAMYEKLKDLF